MSNPTVTVTTNIPSFCMESQTSSISAKRAAIKLHTPIGEYLESKGCLKAGLLVQFFMQVLFQFSMKFLSRVSSCDKTVAAISQRFQTCYLQKLSNATQWQSQFGKSRKTSHQNVLKSPRVYTCDESCVGERDRNRLKNCKFKPTLKLGSWQESRQFIIETNETDSSW